MNNNKAHVPAKAGTPFVFYAPIKLGPNFRWGMHVLIFIFICLPLHAGVLQRAKCTVAPQSATVWIENEREWKAIKMSNAFSFVVDDMDENKGAAIFVDDNGKSKLGLKVGQGFLFFSGLTPRGSPYDITLLKENSPKGMPVSYVVHTPQANKSLAVSVYTGYCVGY